MRIGVLALCSILALVGMAVVRGRQSLEWTTGLKRSRNEGNQVTVLCKGSDGKWRIALQMWGDPPNQPVNR